MRLKGHRPSLGLPPPQFVRHLAQGAHEIDLDDLSGRRDVIWRFCPAEGAYELLLAWIPLRLRAARRTRMLFEGDEAGHQSIC